MQSNSREFNLEHQRERDLLEDQLHPEPVLPSKSSPTVNNDSNKCGHWSEKENAKYYAFIDKFNQKFSQKQARRQWKVFKAMSKFIRTRNPNQCRSHHHKMTKNFQSIQQALEFLKAKNSSVQNKAQKYYLELQNVDFSQIQQGRFPRKTHKISRERGQKRKYQEKYEKNFGNFSLQQEPTKKQDITLRLTDDVYEDYQGVPQVNQYQIPQFNFAGGPLESFPTTGLLNNLNYGYPQFDYQDNFQYQYQKSKEEVLMQCHDLFIKWTMKMNQYIQM